jgi:hypothetical protein
MKERARYIKRQEMKTFGMGIFTSLLVLFLIVGMTQPADAAKWYIKLDKMEVGPTNVEEGDNVKIKCHWSFHVESEQGIPYPMGLCNIYIYPESYPSFEPFKEFKGFVLPGKYPAGDPVITGVLETTWQAQKPAIFQGKLPYKFYIKCNVLTALPGTQNPVLPDNYITDYRSIIVNPKKLTLKNTSPVAAQPGGPIISAKPKADSPPTVSAKPSAGAIAAVAKPNLSITGVQVKIEPNCQAPQPAMTAIVTIKNTGGALPANKGTVFVKEQGGTNLGSTGIQIPAIGAGQTQVVNIPAATTQPYSSLAGTHQIQAILNPQSKGGQLSFNKPADPYMFLATFPSGHCKSAR